MSEVATIARPEAPRIPLGRRIQATRSYQTFKTALWNENAIFRQILGICSALAVTNLVKNTLVMAISVVFVTVGSNFLYSLIRNVTPTRTRMLVQMLVIAGHVILVHQFLQAYVFEVSEQIGAYIGLIITNCIILGRVEAFASKNGPWLSSMDGLGAGLGYSFVLLVISFPRELLAFGSIFGFQIIPDGYTRWNIMAMAPAGFFGLAVVIWVCRAIQLRATAAAPGGGGK